MGTKISLPLPVAGETRRSLMECKPKKSPSHRKTASANMEPVSQSRPELTTTSKHRSGSGRHNKTKKDSSTRAKKSSNKKLSREGAFPMTTTKPTNVEEVDTPAADSRDSRDVSPTSNKAKMATESRVALPDACSVASKAADAIRSNHSILFEADVSTIASEGSYKHESLRQPTRNSSEVTTEGAHLASQGDEGESPTNDTTPQKSNITKLPRDNSAVRKSRLNVNAPEFVPRLVAKRQYIRLGKAPGHSLAHEEGTSSPLKDISPATSDSSVPIVSFRRKPVPDIFVLPRWQSRRSIQGGRDKTTCRVSQGRPDPIKSSPMARYAMYRPLTNRAVVQPSMAKATKPKVFSCNGVKVTMVDEDVKLFVIDLVPPKVCDLILKLTDAHVDKEGFEATWRTLYTYTHMDLPCCEVNFLPKLTDQILELVIKVIGDVFGNPIAASSLKPRSWKEPHLLRYQKVDDKSTHTGVEMHYDGSHFTWQLMLSDPKEYEGGGTYFRCLRKTIRLKKGQVLVHSGELYHKGVDITSGERNLVVCFMDGYDPRIMDPSCWSDEKKEYEARVCSY